MWLLGLHTPSFVQTHRLFSIQGRRAGPCKSKQLEFARSPSAQVPHVIAKLQDLNTVYSFNYSEENSELVR